MPTSKFATILPVLNLLPLSNLHPLAQKLNDEITADNPRLFELLSVRGKNVFFPSGGILGQTAEAKGKKFNATIGIALDDDNTPMRLPSMDHLINMDPSAVYPYASSYGKQPLREKWAEMIHEKNPSLEGETSMPVVTNGLTHSLSMAAYLFLDPGENLILPDLFWGNYNLMFNTVYGTELQTFNTFTDGGFDTESLRDILSQDTGKKVLLLNFPNNPTGYTPTNAEVEKILNIIKERAEAGDHLVIIIDDAYFGLVYEDGVYTESIFAPLATLHENVLAVKVDGATKEDYVWGHRIGFCTVAAKGMTTKCADAFASKIAGAVRSTISNACHLSQSLLLETYKSPSYNEEKLTQYTLLKKRYKIVKEVLDEAKYAEFFTPLPFNSGYFMCVQLNDALDAEEVRKTLLEQHDTGVIATGNKLRIAYSSLPTKLIPSLFENIYTTCSSLSSNSTNHEHNTPVTSAHN
ncbi:MAG: aminotransferase class I/II-fold pyridoxal phosphate-dependent enzyme [bacterium]|nr:aminotransferase class I/II-fold pyridoxal phosphate-dependent enzyme [bacterium]